MIWVRLKNYVLFFKKKTTLTSRNIQWYNSVIAVTTEKPKSIKSTFVLLKHFQLNTAKTDI